MSKIRTAVTVAAIGVVGILAANGVAAAATGQSFLLGRHNYANIATTLQRTTKGAPLSLLATSGSAPLAVNSSGVVTHLNADLLDGKNAADLQTSAIRYVIPRLANSTTRNTVVLNGVPHGIYAASFNIFATMDSSGTTVSCYLSTDKDKGTGDSQLLSYGTPYLSYSTTNASGVIDYRTGTGLTLTCFGNNLAAFNYAASDTFRECVTLVRIDRLTVRTNSVQPAVRHRGK